MTTSDTIFEKIDNEGVFRSSLGVIILRPYTPPDSDISGTLCVVMTSHDPVLPR